MLHALCSRSAWLPCIYCGIAMNLRRERPGWTWPRTGPAAALVSMVVAVRQLATASRRQRSSTKAQECGQGLWPRGSVGPPSGDLGWWGEALDFDFLDGSRPASHRWMARGWVVLGVPGPSQWSRWCQCLCYSPVAQAAQGSRLEAAWSFFSFVPFLRALAGAGQRR